MTHSAPMPVVSVIIPTHNYGAYIGEALDSVSAQTVTDIEIIVVDDGSSDDTVAIVETHAMADARIRIVRRDTASGRPARPRNDGIRLARGRYVAFLDADDIWTPHHLVSAIAAMESTGAGVAFGDYRNFQHTTGQHDLPSALQTHDFLQRAAAYIDHIEGSVYMCRPTFVGFLLAHLPAIVTPTVVLERTLLDNEPIWFDESLVCGEDFDLWFRLGARTQFVYVDQLQAYIRKHTTSITTIRHYRTIEDVATVRLWNLQRLRTRLTPDEVHRIRMMIAGPLWDVGYHYWACGERRAARRAYRKSWEMRPSLRTAMGYIKAWIPYMALRSFAKRDSQYDTR